MKDLLYVLCYCPKAEGSSKAQAGRTVDWSAMKRIHQLA